MADFYHAFRIGDVEVTAISEGRESFALKVAIDRPESDWQPFITPDEHGGMPIAITATHVALPGQSILIDAGLGEATEENRRLEQMIHAVRDPGIGGWLAARNLPPDAIDLVAITHAHGDHVQGAVVERDGRFRPRFPRARYVLGRADFEARTARGLYGEVVNRWLDGLSEAGVLDLVDGETEIAPGLTHVPTPGESPGHGAYRLESGGQVLYVIGDLFHHPTEVTHVDWAPVGRDKASLRASREMLIERAIAEDALVLTAHFPFPGLGRPRRAGAGAVWEAIQVGR